MAGTHFKGPLLFSSARASLENLKQSMWPDQFTYMDDFYEGAVDTTLKWTIVKDSGATAAIVADATGGEIALTSTATTENDGASIQGKHEIFSLPTTAGDSIWFETRIKTSDADQMDVLVGLTETFATNPENALASSNIIGFLLADGSAVISGVTEASDTATVVTFSDTTKSTLADDTFVTLGYKATKGTTTDTVRFYINRQEVGASQTNIPTANLKLCAMSVSGTASGTQVTTLDYIMAAQDRAVSYE